MSGILLKFQTSASSYWEKKKQKDTGNGKTEIWFTRDTNGIKAVKGFKSRFKKKGIEMRIAIK